MDKDEEKCWDALVELPAEDAIRAILSYHGTQLFDKAFREFLEDEGILEAEEDDDEEEEEEDYEEENEEQDERIDFREERDSSVPEFPINGDY